jgi:hypothetical protein
MSFTADSWGRDMNKLVSRLLLVALFAALFVPAWVSEVRADCPTLGLSQDNSTSGNARAPSTRWKVNRAVYLILGSELTASNIGTGNITGIGWNYQTAPGVSGAAELKVYLQETTDTAYSKTTSWATSIVGMTLVHDATTTLPGTAGEFDFLFSGGSPFAHTAGNGLYVAFEWGGPTGYTGPFSVSTVVWCNSTGLGSGLRSNQSTTATAQSDTMAASNFRPETWLVAPGAPLVDASVDYVISMGAVPQGVTGAQTVQATVFQNGDSDLTDTNVHLDISGDDTFSDDVNVPSLLRCGTGGSVVTFSPYTPTNLGSDAVTASLSVPGDVDNSNDSLTQLFEFTPQRYSYQHLGTPLDGGVGLNGQNGEFVNKFAFTAPSQIDTIDLQFFANSATTYRLEVLADSGTGTPGATLYVDSADRTVTTLGVTSLRLPSPLAIAAGNYFVGIQQTNTTNANYGFNLELPVRSGTFYFRTPFGSGTWNDFSPGNNFALATGIVVGNCTGAMTVDVTPNVSPYNICGNTVPLTASAVGGFRNLTYQWEKNGVDIPGATSFTYNASETSGTFSYNCKVTDDAGCIDVRDTTASVVTWGPTATVSGGGTICVGVDSTTIQAALTGAGPWSVTWSDGFVQSVTSSPATRTVSPSVPTIYTVTAVSDANCSGFSSGSATVTGAETASGDADLSWGNTKDTLGWPTDPSVATYTLYRGDGANIANLATNAIDSCTRFQGAGTTATGLTETPAGDAYYWYVLTGTTGAGCVGSAGPGRFVNSSGTCP